MSEELGQGVNREDARQEANPTAGQVPEADQQAVQTTEQQKVEALFNKTAEANHQLGDELAHEVMFTDGSRALLFKKLVRVGEIADDRTVNGFGVNSLRGPIKIADGQRSRYNPRAGYTVEVPKTEDGKLPSSDFDRVTSDEDLRAWQEAFENSRDAVLRHQETMQRVREQRSQSLDTALDVVSKPIDLNAPPPSETPPPTATPSAEAS